MTRNLSVLWGCRIKQMRAELGLSQRAVAARAEIDKGYYARIENGKLGSRGVGDEVRIRLAQALGARVEEIFSYPDTTDQEPACPSAVPATGEDSSPTPATQAATRSPAPNVKAPAASASAESPGDE